MRAYKKIVADFERMEASITPVKKDKKKKKESNPLISKITNPTPPSIQTAHRSPPPPPIASKLPFAEPNPNSDSKAAEITEINDAHVDQTRTSTPPCVLLRTEVERIHPSAIPLPPNSSPPMIPVSPTAKIFNRSVTPTFPLQETLQSPIAQPLLDAAHLVSPFLSEENKDHDLDALEKSLLSNGRTSSWIERYSVTSKPKSPLTPPFVDHSTYSPGKYSTPMSINEFYRDPPGTSPSSAKKMEEKLGRNTMIYSKEQFGIFGAPVPLPDRENRYSLSPGHLQNSPTTPSDKKEHPLRQALRTKSPQLAIRRLSGDNTAPLSGPVYNTPDPQSPPAINSRAFSKEVHRLPVTQRYQEAMTVSSLSKSKKVVSTPSAAVRTQTEWK